jgi:hypothetical protein
VVWEGWHREVSPNPDCIRLAYLREQLCESLDETAGRLDGGRGLVQRDDRIRTCLVVGNGLQLVTLREEAPQLHINARLVGDQFQKLAVNSSVGLGHTVGPLKY